MPESQPALPAKIRFERQDYNVDAGTEMLIALIRDPATAHERRVAALRSLHRVARQLKDTSPIDNLIKTYPNFQDRDSKGQLLWCLRISEDTRALPLFYRALDNETDPVVRTAAALGLAQWNIRRGVEELIQLLDADTLFEWGEQTKGLEELLAKWLEELNRRKAWGFPSREVQMDINKLKLDDRKERVRIYSDHWKAWFAANKHRFPDWHPPKDEKAPEPPLVPPNH